MNLNVSKRSNGRVYLAIVKTYRNKETGRNSNKTVKSLGYVDELESQYPDPITHFREVAKQMTDEENVKRYQSISFDLDEELDEMDVNIPGTRNLGYAVPLKVFHELELHKFLKKKARSEDFEFNTASIMMLLVISRILSPGSKHKAFNEKSRYFERFDFTLDDVYRALTHFNKISPELQQFMYEKRKTRYGSDTHIVYYDVTNYYFEISSPDELRKYGKPKQNRKKPVVQMGLAMDKDGIPLHYELFPGNKLDKETFRSVIGEVRKTYDTGRIIAVADMGIITGDNIWYIIGGKPEKPRNGYVFSFSVRGGTDEFKKYVLDDTGYVDEDGEPATEKSDFKIKSEVKARTIKVTMTDGTKKDKIVYEKKVVFWSKKYAVKARTERAEVLAKAMDMIAEPKKYNKATAYGAASYVENIDYDKETGEVIGKTGKILELKLDKIKAEEMFDGYYSIVTSELKMSDSEIIDTYHGLWEIEETFKITKSDLESRPVYVYDHAHINAHFLICFIALTILRIIQRLTAKKYSARAIIDCLNKIVCINESENIYLFGYRNKITSELGKAFGIDLKKKRLRLADIKKIIGDTKK
jgi:transposase